MKEKEYHKYLGQIISAGGLADSVKMTIESRLVKISNASKEIIKVVNDWRSRCVGGMETAILLWEKCCIPSLLHGSGTWIKTSPDTIKVLNKIQHNFLRMVLSVGPGAPVASLCFESGVLDMEIRIWIELCMVVLDFRNKKATSLATIIYDIERKNNQATYPYNILSLLLF